MLICYYPGLEYVEVKSFGLPADGEFRSTQSDFLTTCLVLMMMIGADEGLMAFRRRT